MTVTDFPKNQTTERSSPAVAGGRFLAGVLFFVLIVFMPRSGMANDFFRIADLQSQVVVEGGAESHEFTVELAETPSHRARGLMYRESIPDDYGMLFIFDEVEPVVMWMKNTFISLDMLFIDENGLIVHIAHRTTPQSLSRISSRYPVKAVLEIRGGLSEELGIDVGQKLVHEAFAAPAAP